MLRIVRGMQDLQFRSLMDVYIEANEENGVLLYPNCERATQIMNAEQDYYTYLRDIFFRQTDSFYAVWDMGNHYGAALRVEPYRDGYLLCALEVPPILRRRGLAARLVAETLAYLAQQGKGKIYSHVSKSNVASMQLHQKCGFDIYLDHAVYSDGSVLNSAYTLCLEYGKAES